MDGEANNPITRCPRRTFEAGGIKMIYKQNVHETQLKRLGTLQGISRIISTTMKLHNK